MILDSCHIPIVLAPLAGGPSTPELAAAVSNAGGLGFIAAGYLTAAELADRCGRTQELTDRPFGVNLFVPGPAGDADRVRQFAAEIEGQAGTGVASAPSCCVLNLIAVFPLLSKRLRIMLDIELIRSDPESVRAALRKRIDNVDLGPILEADALRRKLATEVDGVRSERNRRAKEIGKLKASGADTAEAQKQAAELGDRVTVMQAALTEAEETLQDLLMGLPNLPDERSPAGGKEANQVVRTWGKQPDLGDKPLDHVELCTRLVLQG